MGTAIPRPYREDSATTAMQIEGSLQFNESVECYMTRTATSGNRRTFTMSCWYRRTVNDSSDQTILFGGPNGDDTYPLTMNSDNMIMVLHYQGGVTYKIAGPQLRDYAGWVHLVSVHDTPQATASNRLKLYMNGVQITNFSTETYPSQYYDTSMNENGVQQRIGFQVSANAFELDGYLTEFNFLDGMALGPGYFGFTDPLTGTWKPKKFKKPGQPLGTTVNDGKQWSATIGDFTNGANVFNGNMGNQGYANNTGVTSPSDYQTDLTVEQLDRDDTVLKTYILRNCFPLVVGEVALSSAEATEIETFDVTWKYQHFEASGVNF